MFKENALKKRVEAGQPCLGFWLGLGDATVAELTGYAGYDFAIIDTEHGFGGLNETLYMMRTLAAFDTTAMVRVPGQDPAYLKRVLDAGAQALMIPMVETAEEAKAIVSACRYPPLGVRGSAAPVVRASGYGTTEDYVERAADELFIAVQAESVTAIDNAAEIAAVDGVDMVFIGANDLSGSLNMLGHFDRPEVAEQIARCVREVKSVGKPLGTIPRPNRDYAGLLEDGFILMAGQGETSILRAAFEREVGDFRALTKS